MGMLRNTLLAGLAALAVTGCGSGNSASSPHSNAPPNTSTPHNANYPRPFETAFIKSCEVRGTPSRCECALKNIEASVSYPDVVNATPAIKAGRPPQWYVAALTNCANAR